MPVILGEPISATFPEPSGSNSISKFVDDEIVFSRYKDLDQLSSNKKGGSICFPLFVILIVIRMNNVNLIVSPKQMS